MSLQQSNKTSTIYFSGLNGIRAIAAIAVVITHVLEALSRFHLNPLTAIFGTFPNGQPKDYLLGDYGVTIFFALSGFLITYLLQAEKDKQDINIKKFYIRRVLRIWPLYYMYMAVCVTVALLTGYTLELVPLLLYLFFAANIPFIFNNLGGIPYMGHYWSLGVEEQFYLFWPWLNKKLKQNTLIKLTITIIAIIMLCRIGIHFLYRPDTLLEKGINITRFHCMMIGGLGAIFYKRKSALFLKLIDNKWTQIFCWLVVLSMAINKYKLASFIDNEFISVVTVCIIIGQINIKNRIVNLETSVFNFLGKISYGIYIIHPLVILLFQKTINRFEIAPTPKYLILFIGVTVLSILLAYLSYTYVEKYFLTFKKKFEVVKSSASRVEAPTLPATKETISN